MEKTIGFFGLRWKTAEDPVLQVDGWYFFQGLFIVSCVQWINNEIG
ncbi:hypothetical protein HMPREF1987_00445 [Peptostreptococcaceae bacterium oral taxon 113 str. W5053]|nr:hypothetical protein HMPREF1987_00445 [Peptostreptococcaceae bacterium oral taxon 113 str. W5053]